MFCDNVHRNKNDIQRATDLLDFITNMVGEPHMFFNIVLYYYIKKNSSQKFSEEDGV